MSNLSSLKESMSELANAAEAAGVDPVVVNGVREAATREVGMMSATEALRAAVIKHNNPELLAQVVAVIGH